MDMNSHTRTAQQSGSHSPLENFVTLATLVLLVTAIPVNVLLWKLVIS